ncbi:MAG: hypothetical protein AAFY88_01170 [Acidobacteriota bacterium]
MGLIMPRRWRPESLWAAVLAGALLSLAVLSGAPASAKRPDKAFRKGVQAADRGEWAKVERWMREAIQLDSAESRRKISITGMRYEQYLPYYYLGLALQAQGRSEAARTAWATSRAQDAWRHWRDAAAFEHQWRGLVARIGPPPPRPIPRLPPPPKLTRVSLREAVGRLEAARDGLGPPSTPRLQLLLDIAEALGDAARLGGSNQRPSQDEMATTATRLQQLSVVAEKVRRSTRRRSEQQLIDDVLSLAASAEGKAGVDDLKSLRVELGLELGRNQPDIGKLKLFETELLQKLFPELGAAR